MQKDSWTGKNLREMFRTGTRLLNGSASSVNALNVFPVPDGDTGTNMVLTMQSAMYEANQCPDNDASAVAQAMARGALMGARGNSGVILSQILRGMAMELEGKKSFSTPDMVRAFLKASVMADRAVSQPAEGTILTVMRDAAAAGEKTCGSGSADLQSLMEALVREARESVERTPSLLPVLRESGVVDAGGEGLRIILEGVLYHLQGREVPEGQISPEASPVPVYPVDGGETEYGYCTEFIVQGADIDLAAMRVRLEGMGEHAIVVGDERTAKVHVHTFDPGAVLSYGTSLGTLHRVKIDNMAEQHREFITRSADESARAAGRVSTVTVVSGTGLMEVFRSLGATVIIPGGETMNPSVEELLRAVESVPSEEVILLPNNPNILLTAERVCEMALKRVAIVPTRTIMQGVTAMVTFNFDDTLENNVVAMTADMGAVRTGRIATAVRSMQSGELKVNEGQVIGFRDDELIVAESSMETALSRLLDRIGIADCEIMTVYYGNEIDWAEAEKQFEPFRAAYPDLEIEVIFGGQPHYDYLISAE